MAIAFVQSAQTANVFDSSAHTCAYGAGVTAGNLLVVVVNCFGSVTVTVADSLGQTFSQAGSYSTLASNKESIWYFPNTAGGANTVTVTPSGNSFLTITVLEYSGADKVSPLGNTAAATGNSTAPATGSVTANAGDLVVATYGQGDGVLATSTVASPFTSRQLNLNGGSRCGGQVADDVNATGSEGATFTVSSSVNWAAMGASFRQSYPNTASPSLRATPPVVPGGPDSIVRRGMSPALLTALANPRVPFKPPVHLPYTPVVLPGNWMERRLFPFGVVVPTPVPGTGKNRPFLPRVPAPNQDDEQGRREYYRRLARHTEILADFFNSVAAKGQVRQNAPADWDINPAGGLNTGLTGHYE